MEPDFWQQRWRANQIGFHEPATHPMLLAHWDALGVEPGARVFVPLCGKSLDMHWLRERGHEVVGVELSEIAVEAFFEEAALKPTRRVRGDVVEFTAAGYTLLCGDLFDVAPGLLGPFGAVYDRAALIALPPSMRHDYARAVSDLAAADTRMLLVTVEYGSGTITPPPFEVAPDEVARLYGGHWNIEQCDRAVADVKGQPGFEAVFVCGRR